MFAELKQYLRRPTLYERTEEKFWTEPYIAARMLKAHLDPDTDAASRRPEFIARCADWVATLAPAGAKLLDIGCGPGLYASQFAQRGLAVTGLDFSESSIAYAREHDPHSQYMLGDYLCMDFEDAFDIITLIYFDYGALIPQERRELLGRVHKALRPGGLFLFDVYTPLRGRGRKESTTWEAHEKGGFWSPEPHICLAGEYIYGDIAEGRRHVVIGEDGARCYNIWDCYFTKQSLAEETRPLGFEAAGFYADATGRPYSDDSETMCAVLRKTT